jgi:DNA anti-recombination protein RmuC
LVTLSNPDQNGERTAQAADAAGRKGLRQKLVTSVAAKFERALLGRKVDVTRSFDGFVNEVESMQTEIRGAVTRMSNVAQNSSDKVLEEFENELRQILDAHKNHMVTELNKITGTQLNHFGAELEDIVQNVIVGFREEVGGKMCPECSRLSLQEANFCDMCQYRFEGGKTDE